MGNTASLTLEQIQKIGRRDRYLRTFNRYLFVIPALVLFFVFTILPLVIGTFYSLTDYNMIQDWTWAGLRICKSSVKQGRDFYPPTIPPIPPKAFRGR